MNLSMDVLRLLTVRALRGRTWAMDRVFDSPSTPADIRTQTEKDPFIAVFVDEGDVTFAEGDQMGDFSLHAPGTTRVVIEVGVSSPKIFDQTPNGDDESPEPQSYVTSINATDPALELQIGLISRQAMDTLVSTSESNPWAEMWRLMTGSQILGVEIRRGGPQTEGTSTRPRYASRVTMIRTGMLSDPPRGSDLEEFTFWRTFLAMCDADEEFRGIGQLIRAHIEQPSGAMPEWREAQKVMAVHRSTVEALGITPLYGVTDPPTSDHPVEPITEITPLEENPYGE